MKKEKHQAPKVKRGNAFLDALKRGGAHIKRWCRSTEKRKDIRDSKDE